VPVVKAEVDQVETDQAPELEATEVEALPVVGVKALPVVGVPVRLPKVQARKRIADQPLR